MGRWLSISLILGVIASLFAFTQQLAYPKFISNRKVRGLEKNLMPMLQSFLVQLNSGVPLFNIMVNVSYGGYGEISEEFKKAVKEINAGKPQDGVIEEIAANNPSILFRRSIWQIANGMKSGSDMSSVIKDIIDGLSEEQVIQIQQYGAQLNPLAMFYMMIAVIIPSLSVTLVIVISSFASLPEATVKFVFWGIFGFVVFLQIIFIGIMKSRRPNLLMS